MELRPATVPARVTRGGPGKRAVTSHAKARQTWCGLSPDQGAWGPSSLLWGHSPLLAQPETPSLHSVKLGTPGIKPPGTGIPLKQLTHDQGRTAADVAGLLRRSTPFSPRSTPMPSSPSADQYHATIRDFSRAALTPKMVGSEAIAQAPLIQSARRKHPKAAQEKDSDRLSNRNPVTGQIEWCADILATGTLLSDYQNREATGLRSVRSILKISSRRGLQRRGGSRTMDDDDLDPIAISELTRLPVSYIEQLYSSFIAMIGTAQHPMKAHHFKKFLYRLGFRDTHIVKRMFESFDVMHNNCLTFEEFVVGLSFFCYPECKWSQQEKDDLHNEVAFSEFCTKFFDLDGHERMSKLKLYKVCSTVLDKASAHVLTASIYEVISGTFATITNQEFLQCLRGNEQLRNALHCLMVLQGLRKGTVGHRKMMGWLDDCTGEWVRLTKAGRSFAMEQLVRSVKGASPKKLEEVSAKAEEYQKARSGIQAVHASYYLQVLRGLIEKGETHITKQYSRIMGALYTMQPPIAGKARELLKVETLILEGFHQALDIKFDNSGGEFARRPISPPRDDY